MLLAGTALGGAALSAGGWPGEPDILAPPRLPLPPPAPMSALDPATEPARATASAGAAPATTKALASKRLMALMLGAERAVGALPPLRPMRATLAPPSVMALAVSPGHIVKAVDVGSAPSPGLHPAALIEPAAGAAPSVPAEPVASVTMRRDPLDLPLLDSDRWREWLLAAVINGRSIEGGAFIIEEPGTGRLAVELETARAWRLVIDEDKVITFQGLPFYPLDAIDEAVFQLDPVELTLRLDAPARSFVPYELALTERERLAPQTGIGGFLDYDLLGTVGQGIDSRLDGLLELGAFAPLGTLISSLRLQDLTSSPEIIRLETTFARDFPDSRATLRFGDSLSTGGSFARGVRFGGMQYATNFATDPSLVTFPLPAIGGLAEQQSVVEVLIDNITRATSDVPAGPFTIANVPVVTGAGEVQIKVTDLLGRERLVTQGYYVSPRLLRSGLHDFAYEIGAERREFGTSSFDYGDPLGTATHRYGLTDEVTVEAHAEASPGRLAGIAGGGVKLGGLGVLTAGIGGSIDDDLGPAAFGQVAVEGAWGPLNLSLRSRYAGADLRLQGEADTAPRRVDEARLGIDLGKAGRVGLLALNQSRRDQEDSRSLTASWSLPLGPGSLIINAARSIEPNDEMAITASYSLPLGPQRSISAQVRTDDQNRSAAVIYRKSRGATDLGLDYRLGAEIGRDQKQADVRMDYNTAHAGLTFDGEVVDGDAAARVGVGGSIAVLDGEIGATRRIGRAFGLVDLPGLPDLPVYVDNREVGRTDDDGKLIVTDLRPYQANTVRVAVENLPLDMHGPGETTAVPYDRSGVRLDLGIEHYRAVTARLVDAAGAPLPGGTFLSDAEGAVTALVGKDGLAEIGGLPEAGLVTIEAQAASGRIACMITAPAAGDDPLPDLGDIACAP